MLLLLKRRVPTRGVSKNKSRRQGSKSLLTKLTLLPVSTTKRRNASGLSGGRRLIPQIHSLKVFLLMADLLRTLLQLLEDASQPTRLLNTSNKSRVISKESMHQSVTST